MEAKLQNAKDFILAGNATFTLLSLKTGTRYTYRVRKAEDQDLWFVSLLTGPENESDYTYLGVIRKSVQYYVELGVKKVRDVLAFSLTKKSKMTLESVPVQAFLWVWSRLTTGVPFEHQVEVWHAGRCGRCGRTLTVPESIEQGFGPECIQMVA